MQVSCNTDVAFPGEGSGAPLNLNEILASCKCAVLRDECGITWSEEAPKKPLNQETSVNWKQLSVGLNIKMEAGLRSGAGLIGYFGGLTKI